MADKLTETVERARYMVGNPSAWENYDERASETIRSLLAALTPAGEDERNISDPTRRMEGILGATFTPRSRIAGEDEERDRLLELCAAAKDEQAPRISRVAATTELLDALPAFLAALSRPNVDEMREALEKCRAKFLHYEDLHRLKCTSEGDEKADRNREMADMCTAALGSAS